MSIEGIIRQDAREVATQLQTSTSRLEKEYADLQTKADAIKAKRDLARTASDRRYNFPVKSGADYNCPACWIEREALGRLISRHGQPHEDIFTCATCGHTIPVPC
jgi:hypothetical protein